MILLSQIYLGGALATFTMLTIAEICLGRNDLRLKLLATLWWPYCWYKVGRELWSSN